MSHAMLAAGLRLAPLLLVLTSAAPNSWLAAATPAPKPNILVILADDLGYGDLGCYGHPRIETPNLDRLAAEGRRFTQFYATHSVCTPTRASFITGQFPARWRMHGPLGWLADNAKRNMPDWLDVRAPSMPRALQQAGYRTGFLGKWHLGGGSGRNFGGRPVNSADAPPVKDYGFDEARAFVGNGPTWLGAKPVEEAHDVYPYEDRELVQHSGRILTDAAIDFLRRNTGTGARPFFLNVWLHDAHVPLAPTEEMLARYRDIEDRGARAYFAVVTEMDRQIGRLLAELDARGLRDNTLVIFTSDNGTPSRTGSQASGTGLALDTDTAGSNGALRGWKWHLYEGGIRVPMIARWPGVIPAGDSDAVIGVCDLAATFVNIAGAKMPTDYKPDGIDALPALRGESFTRTSPLFWQNATANRRGPVLAVRDGDWKLLMESDGTDAQLFDLKRDPGERRNLAEANPAVVERLSAQLFTWVRTLPR